MNNLFYLLVCGCTQCMHIIFVTSTTPLLLYLHVPFPLHPCTLFPTCFQPPPLLTCFTPPPLLTCFTPPSTTHSCAVDGATQECCALIKEAVKPSSAAWFASCLCKPDFWAAAQQVFTEAGKGHDVAAVMDQCIQDVGASVQYLGQQGSACPRRGEQRTATS